MMMNALGSEVGSGGRTCCEVLRVTCTFCLSVCLSIDLSIHVLIIMSLPQESARAVSDDPVA